MKRSSWKKTTAVLTAGLLLAGAPLAATALVPTAAHAGNPIYSTLQGHYSEGAVKRLASYGVLTSNEWQAFNPDEPVTRADFDRWVQSALHAKPTHLTGGNNIPRWEAAEILEKIRSNATGDNGAANADMFVDHEQIPPEARAAVGRLYKQGIVVGEGYGLFCPNWKLTRGEAAVMLNALLPASQGLQIGADDNVVLRKDNVDLNNDGKAQETLAVVANKNESKPGYLGLFDRNGRLQTRFNLDPEVTRDPVQLLVNDVTGDGKNDLILESDLHGNGGMGAHDLRVFVQGANGTFSSAKVQQPDWAAKFNSITLDTNTLTWNIKSTADNRSWTVQLVGPQWNGFDPSFLQKPYQMNVDNPYSVSVVNGKLTTRHWAWVGHHIMGVFDLVPSYKYVNGAFVVDSYQTEQVPGTKLTQK
ncbi:S-layer homology domain-containing protein [Tumebacillus flagellatus]|uniref:SLH domain-containing protein n=1 Tax=Tumebacillus flagellatus TaxID=1157490 RepID=A0A074LUK9_9BACL|nr:S-layer homology domain-containing protein [Tumebacillus flagellatus]KEO84295.1 hypothetical protein EL26_05880 [Tumebacillus flagellatus]